MLDLLGIFHINTNLLAELLLVKEGLVCRTNERRKEKKQKKRLDHKQVLQSLQPNLSESTTPWLIAMILSSLDFSRG